MFLKHQKKVHEKQAHKLEVALGFDQSDQSDGGNRVDLKWPDLTMSQGRALTFWGSIWYELSYLWNSPVCIYVLQFGYIGSAWPVCSFKKDVTGSVRTKCMFWLGLWNCKQIVTHGETAGNSRRKP